MTYIPYHYCDSLVHQSIGRLKEARDRAAPDSMTYYQSLVKKAYSVSVHDHWVYLNIEWLYKLETEHGVSICILLSL